MIEYFAWFWKEFLYFFAKSISVKLLLEFYLKWLVMSNLHYLTDENSVSSQNGKSQLKIAEG